MTLIGLDKKVTALMAEKDNRQDCRRRPMLASKSMS
jgi:hypothetical protein